MSLKDTIKTLSKMHGVTLSTVEEELGFASGYLSKLDKSTPNTKRIQQIANYFGVTVDYLMNGEEPEQKEFNPQLTPKDEKDISKKVDEILSQLSTGDALMFDGEPMDEETKELLRLSLENGVRIAKVSAKKKFTPKKYR